MTLSCAGFRDYEMSFPSSSMFFLPWCVALSTYVSQLFVKFIPKCFVCFVSVGRDIAFVMLSFGWLLLASSEFPSPERFLPGSLGFSTYEVPSSVKSGRPGALRFSFFAGLPRTPVQRRAGARKSTFLSCFRSDGESVPFYS